MSMYAEEQDIIDQYGPDELIIASDKENTGEPDPVVVVRALTGASTEIDAYVLVRYPQLTPGQKEMLKPLCVDIALYKMSTGTAITEEKRKRYEDAIKFLTKVGEGRLLLSAPDSASQPVNQGGASFVASPRQFSRESMKGY